MDLFLFIRQGFPGRSRGLDRRLSFREVGKLSRSCAHTFSVEGHIGGETSLGRFHVGSDLDYQTLSAKVHDSTSKKALTLHRLRLDNFLLRFGLGLGLSGLLFGRNLLLGRRFFGGFLFSSPSLRLGLGLGSSDLLRGGFLHGSLFCSSRFGRKFEALRREDGTRLGTDNGPSDRGYGRLARKRGQLGESRKPRAQTGSQSRKHDVDVVAL